MTLIDSIIAVHRAEGRPLDCPMIQWLEQQRGRTDEDQIRRELVARPDWHPLFSRDGLAQAGAELTGEERKRVQQIYFDHLIRAGAKSEKLRPFIGLKAKARPDLFDPDIAAQIAAWSGVQ